MKSMDVKRELTDSEIEELGAPEPPEWRNE